MLWIFLWTVSSNSYILILVHQASLPSWTWWLWAFGILWHPNRGIGESLSVSPRQRWAPGCFCPGMLAGYQCCCGAYQRATGSSNVRCGRNVFWIFKRTSFMSWMKAGEIESLHHEHRVWGNSWAAHVRLDLSRIYFFQGLRQVIHIVSGQSGQSGQSGYVFHAGCQSEVPKGSCRYTMLHSKTWTGHVFATTPLLSVLDFDRRLAVHSPGSWRWLFRNGLVPRKSALHSALQLMRKKALLQLRYAAIRLLQDVLKLKCIYIH